jgi:hypothetical protein
MTTFRVIEIVMRVDPKILADRWSPENRSIFLLDEAVRSPLSVDDGIWPKLPEGGTRGVRVAILAEPSMPPGAMEESTETEAAAEGPLLGYDVADAWQVSGLTNCGYSPEEKAALTETWRPRLAANGLLRTLTWAKEFVEVANGRVVEHAPFYVYEMRSPDVDRSLVAGVSE